MTRGPVNSNRPRVEGTTLVRGQPCVETGRSGATPHPSTIARAAKRQRKAQRRALAALVEPANPVKPGAGGPPALHAPEQPTGPAPRGPGGRAPHSTRYPIRNAPQQAVTRSFSDSGDPIEGPHCLPPTKQAPRKARHPLNRGAKRSWTAYRKGIARELRELGRFEQARRVRACGETALVYDCAACGETAAAVVVLTHCDSRACPQCAARLARERVDRLSLALHRVADTFHARREAAAAELGAELEILDAMAAKWERCAADNRERFEKGRRVRPETIARAERLAADNRERAKLARWKLARVREDTWGWKLLTISPQWDPSDASAVTVSGLRARSEDCWRRWARVWQKLECGGLGAAVVSLEISSGGHVHVHALVWAPWVHARHFANLAGCFVDIREVRAKDARKVKLGPELAYVEALREACKYAVKAPRVSLEWVRGDRATVTHPALAARWATAMHGRQCGRLLGLARDAMRAHEAAEGIEGAEQAPPVPSCPCCMAPLGAAREARTRSLVHRWRGEIRDGWEWRHRVRFARAMPVDAR